MICASVIGPDLTTLRKQIKELESFNIDLVELRIDLFIDISIDELKKIIDALSDPVILTLRKISHGGKDNKTDDERKAYFEKLAHLRPEYIDLEYDSPKEISEAIVRISPGTNIIISFHDFEKTPQDLSTVLKGMENTKAAMYKIATKANSTPDALQMLNFIQSQDIPFTGLCMGEEGQMTRILQPVFGEGLSYAGLSPEYTSAPGQLTIKSLLETFHYKNLNKETKIFSLLGDPVNQSSGHIIHNAVFDAFELNQVYVTMRVKIEELKECLSLYSYLPFAGFSVTMPLKEYIIPFLDEVNDQVKTIKAANILFIKEGKVIGYNTDGIGALNAIEERISIKGKRFYILGAGGSARAIIYEAVRRGADVTIFNRNFDRAKLVASELGANALPLGYLNGELKKGYDILFNSTNIGMAPKVGESLVPKECFISGTIVMDSVFSPRETKLLSDAHENGCHTISGIEMFINQAVEQQDIWSEGLLDKKTVKKTIRQALGI